MVLRLNAQLDKQYSEGGSMIALKCPSRSAQDTRATAKTQGWHDLVGAFTWRQLGFKGHLERYSGHSLMCLRDVSVALVAALFSCPESLRFKVFRMRTGNCQGSSSLQAALHSHFVPRRLSNRHVGSR